MSLSIFSYVQNAHLSGGHWNKSYNLSQLVYDKIVIVKIANRE